MTTMSDMANATDEAPPARRGWAPGFTLIELLVVMVILGLIAGFAVPRIFDLVGGAKSKAAGIQIERLAAVLDLYRLEIGHYPSTDDGLESLVEPPAGTDNWNGPYIKKAAALIDPWNEPYLYAAPGDHGDYDLYSLGADGAEGGDGEDQDMTSW